VRPSMGSVGDAYDNALCQSFFATLECELLDQHAIQTKEGRGGDNSRLVYRTLVQSSPPILIHRLCITGQVGNTPCPCRVIS
jgi:hypothetical protein